MNVYDNEEISDYRRSSGSGRKKSSRTRKKTKPIGKFEIAAFGIVIGFAIGLVVGLGIGGFGSGSSSSSVASSSSQVPPDFSHEAADFEIRARESLQRLEEKGYDVEPLKNKFVELEHNPADVLRAQPSIDGMIPLKLE